MIITDPLVAYRDCDHCRKWLYDEKTGQVHKKRGEPVERAETPVPCDSHLQCPKGHYNKQKSLNERNWMAFDYHRTCKHSMQFPDDSVVKFHAGIIGSVSEAGRDYKQNSYIQQLGQLSAMNVLGRAK